MIVRLTLGEGETPNWWVNVGGAITGSRVDVYIDERLLPHVLVSHEGSGVSFKASLKHDVAVEVYFESHGMWYSTRFRYFHGTLQRVGGP